MSRNFGLGHRDMKIAGQRAIEQAYNSFQSRATVQQRWGQFVEFVRAQGVRRMEHINNDHLRAYALELKNRGLSPSSQQNYVSAVNRVIETARQDREVRLNPTEVADRRTAVAKESKANANSSNVKVSERVGALIGLQREFGLRFEESAKLSASSALRQAEKLGVIKVERGTKGGRTREVPITRPGQLEALRRAAEVQGSDRSMIPADKSYVDFKREAYREIEKFEFRFHGERHAYAQRRYQDLTGVAAPVQVQDRIEGQTWAHYVSLKLGITVYQAQQLDERVRLQIAEELGHSRESITAAYIGGK